MRTIGIDTSHWEGIIDWVKAVDYIPFAYYKATDGEYWIDTQFGNNKDGCDDVGMPHAPYHWWQETQNPLIQAEHFVRTVGEGYKRYIVDVEPFEYYLGMTTKLKVLLDRVQALTSVRPAIYTSANYWNKMQPPVTWANQYDLLVAHYTVAKKPTLPIGWTNWRIWQFNGDNFYFPGCQGAADGNWFNGTLQEARDWFGNYRPFVQPPYGGKTEFVSLFDDLNIRVNPLLSSPSVGHLELGEVIEALDAGGADSWIKHERGWSCYKNANGVYMKPK